MLGRRGVYPRGGSALRSLLHRQAFAVRTPNPICGFAVWQQQWLQGEVLDTQLNYWKQLNGAKMVLEPTDRPRSHVQTATGTKHSFALPSLSHALRSLSQQEGVTLFMTLLAAFNTLLYRYRSGRHPCRFPDRQPQPQ